MRQQKSREAVSFDPLHCVDTETLGGVAIKVILQWEQAERLEYGSVCSMLVAQKFWLP